MARIAPDKNTLLTIEPLNSLGRSISFTNVVLEAFSDSYTINTNPQVVFGRTDPIRTYSNTERTVALTILVNSDTASEAVGNFDKIQQLIIGSYPDYSASDRALKSPPLFLMHMNGYVQEDGGPIVGYFDEVKFEYAEPDSYGNTPHRTDGTNTLVPRYYRLSLVFHPMHSGVKGSEEQVTIDNTFPYGGPLKSF
tara:strand:- start:34678 stop:35262 length:585 start_codon:yes stop_codon:yes gene_type:complete